MPRIIEGHLILIGDRIRLGDLEGVVKSVSIDGRYARHYIVRRDDGKDGRIDDKPEVVGISHKYFAELVADPLPTDLSSWPTSQLIYSLTLVSHSGFDTKPASWRKATKDERDAFWKLLKATIDTRVPVPEPFDNATRRQS